VVQQLCEAIHGPEADQATDAQLLDAFITRKDQAAFEVIVRRYAPMVLGVCRRILRNHHDAEDAFQATFLVLVHKAASIWPRVLVANWLHGVACNTARKAKAAIGRRVLREMQVTQTPEPETAPPDPWLDLLPMLDQVLLCLPEKYRLPIVLCDLQGLSIKEAMQQLGWPQGTVAGRLARGRELLARRLTARGLVVPAGLLTGVWLPHAASASVPHLLVLSAVQFASALTAGQQSTAAAIPSKVLTLTEGVLKAMLLTRLKITGVAVVAALLLLGGGACAYQAFASKDGAGHPEAEQRTPKAASQSPQSAPPKTPVGGGDKKEQKTDQEQLQGKWRLVKAERSGMTWVVAKNGELVCEDTTPKAFPIALDVPLVLSFSGDQLIEEFSHEWRNSNFVEKSTFRLDTSKTPKWITTSIKGEKDVEGIYEFENGKLRICWNIVYGKQKAGRPTGFTTKPASQDDMDMEVWVLQRDKK
jgi:RNA polymerase sigma factor (sigma-70 family)